MHYTHIYITYIYILHIYITHIYIYITHIYVYICNIYITHTYILHIYMYIIYIYHTHIYYTYICIYICIYISPRNGETGGMKVLNIFSCVVFFIFCLNNVILLLCDFLTKYWCSFSILCRPRICLLSIHGWLHTNTTHSLYNMRLWRVSTRSWVILRETKLL
jgi:hypothetical protein